MICGNLLIYDLIAYVLIDSGASHNFIDPSYAKAHGFHIMPNSGSVHCGGNTTSQVLGKCILQVKLGKGFCRRVEFHIVETPLGLPVILGNTWINNRINPKMRQS